MPQPGGSFRGTPRDELWLRRRAIAAKGGRKTVTRSVSEAVGLPHPPRLRFGLRSPRASCRVVRIEVGDQRSWPSPEPPSGRLYSVLAEDADFRDLIADFVQDVPQRVAALQAALVAREWDTLGRRINSTLLGSYGFELLTPPADRLELAVRRRADEAEIAAALDELRTMSQCIRSEAAETAAQTVG